MFTRRHFLGGTGAVLALPALRPATAGQNYPSRPVRILVGYAPGGSDDTYARLIGHWLSERLGQPFLIENRPGGGSNIATDAVAKAAPDGYTLLLVSPANAINATLYERLPFDSIRDVAPVAGMVRQPLVMLVHPSVPAKTIPEFVDHAKAAPKRVAMASAGAGTAFHLAGELFRSLAGVDLIHVPYRSAGPALTDVPGGQVHVYFAGMASALEPVRSGKIRALGITTAARSESLPELAPIGEFVSGYEASDWQGLGAPRGTPAEIIASLNAAVNEGLADAKFRARIAELGGDVIGGAPAEFGATIVRETEKWGGVIRSAGIKLD